MGFWSTAFNTGNEKVPDTIGKKKARDMQRRHAKTADGSIFSPKAIAQRKASEVQRVRSMWS